MHQYSGGSGYCVSGLVPPQITLGWFCRQFSNQVFGFLCFLDLFVWVFCLPVYKCTMYIWWSQRLEEDIRVPGTGATGGYELPCEYWESILGLLQLLSAFNLWAKSPAHKCSIDVLKLSLSEVLRNDLSPRARFLWESPVQWIWKSRSLSQTVGRAAEASEVWGKTEVYRVQRDTAALWVLRCLLPR